MKSYTLVLVTIAAVLLYAGYANAREICPLENCLVLDKCEESVKGDVLCHQQGTSCCSIVKSEFKTHCHHHGGACMDTCAAALQHEVVDCPSNQVCCVLV